jgi:hypothetical protein
VVTVLAQKDRGTDIPKMPVLGKREIDLYELYQRVKNRGGIREVIVDRRWSVCSFRFVL